MTSAILCPKRTVHKMKLNEPEKVEFTKALIPTLCAIIRGADSYPFCHNQTALLCQCPYDVFYTGRRTVPQTLASVLLAAIPASGGLWRCGPSHSPSGRMVFRQCCQHTETHRCTHTHTNARMHIHMHTNTERHTHTHTHTHCIFVERVTVGDQVDCFCRLGLKQGAVACPLNRLSVWVRLVERSI